MTYFLLFLGFYFLIKGADLMVEGASAIARKFGVSNLVIGLTIVAFGTSMPELFVNLYASFQKTPDLAIGNIIGSNIANILLILGVAALIYPLKVTRGTAWKEIPFSLLAVILVMILVNDQHLDKTNFNNIGRSDGLALIGFFAIFLYYVFGSAQGEGDDEQGKKQQPFSILKSSIMILLGIAGLVLGGQWIVNGATEIASRLGMSQSLIGLTVVALGTSLPELATSAVAAYKRNADIAVGNVVGSNIFNVFWILGLSAVISPLPFDVSMNFDLMVSIIASFVLFISLFLGQKLILERWQGGLFLISYLAYTVIIIMRG